MENLVVIPARGGSKGIPKKNIYPLLGKPMLEYTIKAVIESGIKADIVLSTDSEEIISIGEKYREIIVARRPEAISSDTSSTEEALIHAVHFAEGLTQKNYDNIVTLQPTSPLREAKTIRNFLDSFFATYDDFDSQLTFTETKADMWRISGSNQFVRLFPDAPRRRQERESLYVENSMLYLTKKETLFRKNSVLGDRIKGFVISEIEGLDINEKNDIILAEYYLKMKIESKGR